MRKAFCLLVFLGLNSLSIAQTGYGGPPESENTRIAREHQSGGLYNPNSESGSGNSNVPMWGAIAIDTLNFSRWGFSQNNKGVQDVKERAISGCEKENNAKCTAVVTFDQSMCGAVALTPKGFTPVVWSAEKGSSKRIAEKIALKNCNEKLNIAGIKGKKCVLRFPGQCID